MATRKKLYYTVTTPLALDVTVPKQLLIKTLTAQADDYGNVLDQNPSPGTPGDALAKTLAAIGGWFQPAACGTVQAPNGDITVPTGVSFFVQFFDGAGGVPGFGAASIDPATVKSPAVQVWAFGISAAAFISGKLYVQRQHSIEV
jgi:hypothetical protein